MSDSGHPRQRASHAHRWCGQHHRHDDVSLIDRCPGPRWNALYGNGLAAAARRTPAAMARAAQPGAAPRPHRRSRADRRGRARRTDTAYPRLLRWANATQLNVVLGGTDPGMLAALARLPQVAAMSSVIQYNMGLPAPHGGPDLQVNVLSSPDGTLGGSVDRIKVLRGRMFSPRSADEAVVDPLLGQRGTPAARRYAAHDRRPLHRQRARRAGSAARLPDRLPSDRHRGLRRPGGAHHHDEQRAAGPAEPGVQPLSPPTATP